MNSENSLIDQSDTTPLIEQFPLLATAPNGITKLRELILQLAIRGKLGTQDVSDEPARVLFEKIKSINQQLVKQEKIRKDRSLKEISDSEVPYKIPESWIWARLGNIGQIIGGGTPRTSNPDYYMKDGIPWLTPADLYGLKEKFVRKGRRDISEIALSESSAQLLPKGTVLFSSRAPIGYVAIALNSLATNQGFKSCIPFIMEMNEYIYYFLKSAAIEIDAKASGTTFKEISGQEMKQILIPLPPLAEQHRIVEKVDRLMALCDTLEIQQQKEHEQQVRHGKAALKALQNAKDTEELENWWRHITENFDTITTPLESVISLKETILQLAVLGKLNTRNFTDEPAYAILERIKNEFPTNYKNKPRINDVPKNFSLSVPDNWELVSIEYFGEKIVDCPHSTPIFGLGNFACVDTNCINDRGIINEKLRYVDYETFNLRNRRLKPQAGDIVLAREATVGTAVVLPKFPEVCLGQRVMLIRPVKYLDSHFIRLVLSSNVVKQQYLPKLIGSTVPHLNVGDVVKLIIPLPPLAEQHRIVQKVSQFIAICDRMEAQIREREKIQERFANATIQQIIEAPISTIQT